MNHIIAILVLSVCCIGYGLLFRGKSCAGCGGCKSGCGNK